MLHGSFVLPTLVEKTVWAGLYGGHYDIIVFFHKKPTHRMDDKGDYRWNGRFVEVLEEDNFLNVFADMPLEDFRFWWPNVDLTPYTQPNGRPKATEVPYKDLFQITLQFPADAYGDPMPLMFHDDWPV